MIREAVREVDSGLPMFLVGVSLGVPLAVMATRLLRSRLFGVEPADPLTIVVAAGGLVLVAMLAALVPARKAALTSSSPAALP